MLRKRVLLATSQLWVSFISSPYSTSSTKSMHNYFLRKRRKWPLSPYKTKWHQTFTHQLAFQTLQDSAKSSTTSLLSALIDSFAAYQCDPTPNAYHFILKSLTKNPTTWDQIPEVLDHMQIFVNFETPEWILIHLIKFYGDYDMLNHAVELFFTMPKFRCNPSVESLNALLLVLCKKKSGLEIVPQVLVKSQLMNVRIEESSFGILIRSLCRFGKVKYAIELVYYMVNEGYVLDERICSSIVLKMCEQKGCDKVEILGFLEEMRRVGYSARRVDWCNVIRFLVKNEKGLDALEVLNRMKRDGIEPDVLCTNLVLEGLVLEGSYGEAEDVFDDMLVSGLVPDNYTYNVYISGLCMQYKVEEGIKMLASMEELGCRADLITYNTILHALCRDGKLGITRELLVQMKGKGVQINFRTYEIIIGGLVSHAELDEACDLLKDMVSKCFVPHSLAVDEVICGLCLGGSFDKALEVVEEMIGKNVAPGVRAWQALLQQSGIADSFHELTSMNDMKSFQDAHSCGQ